MAAPQETTSPTRRTAELVVLVVLFFAFLAASAAKGRPVGAPDDWWLARLGVVVAAGLTLIMYSFLYRDNPLFKIGENLFVGVALGYGVILTWRQSLRPEIIDPLFVDPPHIHAFWMELARRSAPIVLGILLLTRLSRRASWLSRYSYTIMVGWGAGLGIPVTIHTYVLQQLKPSLGLISKALGDTPAGQQADLWSAALPILGDVIILAGIVSVLFYFFFSVEHKGAGSFVSQLGIWFLMVAFGASFGNTVMGRVSLLIGRMRFLLHDWLGLGP
ncbi:MAG: hypothetical protein FJ291_25785 [Planctomycetes bacterium]|nr:hypothetical protein [Planctomycetota bacterium]